MDIANVERWTSSATALSSRSVFVLLLAKQRGFFPFNDRAVDGDFGDIFAAWDVVHDLEHDPLEHRTQGSGTSPFGHRLSGQSLQCILGYTQSNSLH